MKPRLLIPRLVLTFVLFASSAWINSAPGNTAGEAPPFMTEGFDKLFKQSVQSPASENNHAEGGPGKTFVRELSTITQQDLLAAGNNKSATATELASNFPETSRAELEKRFNIALYVQKRIEKAARVPEGDIPTATASFLYGVWSAYNEGAEIPEENLLELHNQVSKLFTSNDALNKGLDNAAPAQRQHLYEYLSMLGNWMLMFQDTFKNNPDPNLVKNIKDMAKQMLQASFKIDVEKLHISQEGKLSIL
jgi:hypothetical protein